MIFWNILYECEFCINERSGEKIKISNKILIAKGPKERYVIDGFELDEITKENHFSDVRSELKNLLIAITKEFSQKINENNYKVKYV